MTSHRRILVIFIKNPVLGKVKTRLAKEIGDLPALEIYRRLLLHTRQVTKQVTANRIVYYSESIEQNDEWNSVYFDKYLQADGDLGMRMAAAFKDTISQNSAVVLIGSDCPGLTCHLIEQAFTKLENYDLVIGPSIDGGYYLIGMREYYPQLFEMIAWSTPIVLDQTLRVAGHLALDIFLLLPLNDIDTLDDWLRLDEQIKRQL